MTEWLPATPENILRAAEVLRKGGLVAFPTETVYGLGANALDIHAVGRIFTAKERPAEDPLIIHLSRRSNLKQVAQSIPALAQTLAERFWPGPLTLILPKQPAVPDLVTAGLNTVAVRVPAHPIALALIEAADVPVAAPSANRFGHTSPTTAQHVWHDLQARIDILLDGGPTPIGVESTVLDVSSDPPCILRPGGVTREQLQAVIGPVAIWNRQTPPSGGLPSPGLLERHYAPRANVIFFLGSGEPQVQLALMEYLNALLAEGKRVGALALDREAEPLERQGALVFRLGPDVESAARHIYAGLRWLDSQQVEIVLCRDLGEDGLGLAIRDRLQRAAVRVIRV